MRTLERQGVLDAVDVVAVHGFPLDWNHWQIRRVAGQARRDPSGDGAADLGVRGRRLHVWRRGGSGVRAEADSGTAGRPGADRIHWYSLYDLPRAWPATTRHREAEGSSYYRHFYMGLLREDGCPKLALRAFRRAIRRSWVSASGFTSRTIGSTTLSGGCKDLGVKHLRTGLSWADSLRPGADAWFDRQMKALEPFDVTLTFCFTPEQRACSPHHTSPPKHVEAFAEFCANQVRRFR